MDYFLPLALILGAVLLASLLLLSTRPKKSEFSQIKVKTRRRKSKEESLFRVYKFLMNTRTFAYLLSKIERSINPNAGSRRRIKLEALGVLKNSLIIFLACTLAISPFISSIRILVISAIALGFVLMSSIDYFTSKLRTRLLNHFVDFLDIMRSKYFETGGRVDSALFDTIQSLDIRRHSDIIDEAELLHSIIEQPEPELALRDYYQVAPNSYFKLLAGLLSITKENGDVVDDRGSRFAKALGDLGTEVKDEIKLRDRLNFSLKSLNLIAIAPLFVISPIRIWASSNFYPLKKFYDSSLGMLTELVVLLSILLTHYALSKVQKFRQEENEYDNNKFWRKIYAFSKPIVDFIKPLKGSKRFKTSADLRQRALVFDSVEIHYSKKCFAAAAAFVLVLLIGIYTSHINKTAILENPTPPEGYLGGELKGDELDAAEKIAKMDKFFILGLKEGMTAKRVIEGVENKYGLLGEAKERTIKRIITKYKAYTETESGIKEVVAAYLIGFLAFFVPDIALIVKRRMVRMDAMTELSKFQLLALLLMHIKHIGVDDLLEWMEMFSSVYKVPIQQAIMDYDSGAEDCLKTLKYATDDDEFRKLVEHMLSAANTISLEKAFEELENEKKYYETKRSTLYERIVEKKSRLGRFIGFIPTYSVILVYFMFPLIYASMAEINVYFDAFTM